MADVLLAHSYFLKYDAKQSEKVRPYPPLATLYAASQLRERGYSVAVFDAMLSDGEHEFHTALRLHKPRFVALVEDSFNYLVKMCLSRMREAAQNMIEMANDYRAIVIASGPDVTDRPELYFPHGLHYAMLGETDHTFAELLDALTGRVTRELDSVDGLAWRSADGRIHRTTPRSPERQPDRFPFPAWDLLDAERYREAWSSAHGYFSLNVVTTRGCPFHCNWCAKPIWGQRYAMRSPSNVAEEMSLIKRLHKPDHIWFADDIFGLRPKWVSEFASELAVRDARIPFKIQTRADLMSEQAVAGLKEAGCIEVWMGAESGSQRILDAMDKGIEVGRIVTARERLKAAGIKAGFFLQFGYPGETLVDIFETVRMVRETLPDEIGISVSYPLPGTRFYDAVKLQLGAKTNWVESDDLAMMFRGTYRSEFYRKLHHTLHRDLELRHKLAVLCGPHDEAIKAELDALELDWMELGHLEACCRHTEPTKVVTQQRRSQAPDLAEAFN